MLIIKISGTTRPAAAAGAIAGIYRENKRAVVQAIGPAAVYRAIKALLLAIAFLKEDGHEVIFIPELVDLEIDGKERTAIRFTVEAR